MIYFILLLFAFLYNPSLSQPKEYQPQGYTSFLVNYHAIKGDIFLTKLAHKRFAFLDEASKTEINLIRRSDKDYLILFYKDIVALNYYLSEYSKINLEEDAFLHISEPSCLTVSFDKGWKFYWMPDRRFELDTTVRVTYRLYWSIDSSGTFTSTDTIVNTTELSISLPKSARWVKLNSIVNDTMEIPYGFPVKLLFEDSIPLCVPFKLHSKFASSYTSFNIGLKFVTPILPDSLHFYADFNKNNTFDKNEIRTFFPKSGTLTIFDSINTEIKAGIECYAICFKNGKGYKFPSVGYWTTNANNRIKNEHYNFFVMDVASSKWRKNYINQVLKAFDRGYNGVFADDAWNRVAQWGVDAYPPLFYSDSTWFDALYSFLSEIKDSIKTRPLYFNGLYEERALRLLEVSDGGMDEGFAHSHWAQYSSGSSWINACNRGIKCENKFKKSWLPLGGIINNQPEPRLYCVSSFLLSAGKNSYFANAPNYQIFAHYPEFDIPVGIPLVSPKDSIGELKKLDARGKTYYQREFENCIVYLNSNAKDTVFLPSLHGAPQIYVDTLLSISGGRLFTIIADSVLLPKSSKIILKGTSSKLASPALKNPYAKLKGIDKDQILLQVSVECADSSSNRFKSNHNLPLYVIADLSKFGFAEDLILTNDGTSANEKFSTYSAEIIFPHPPNFTNIVLPIVAISTTGLMTITYVNPTIESIDTSNKVLNPSFEFDINFDAIPDGWMAYYKGFEYDTSGLNAQHYKRSIKVTNFPKQDTGGVYTTIYLWQTEAKPILVAGWSKAENVSGTRGFNYSIYCDFWSKDKIPWYGRIASFSTGTHDWEYSATIYYPPMPIEYGRVYCLFRGYTGTVWFDNVFVGEIDTSATFVDNQNDIKIKVPSVVTGQDNEVVLITSNQIELITISLNNILGNKMFEQKFNINNETNVIPLYRFTDTFANGVYFLRIDLKGKMFVFPFLITR